MPASDDELTVMAEEELDAACAIAATGIAIRLVPASASAANFMYRIYRPPFAFVTY